MAVESFVPVKIHSVVRFRSRINRQPPAAAAVLKRGALTIHKIVVVGVARERKRAFVNFRVFVKQGGQRFELLFPILYVDVYRRNRQGRCLYRLAGHVRRCVFFLYFDAAVCL